jgi:methyl-accepting chemotaxis protein
MKMVNIWKQSQQIVKEISAKSVVAEKTMDESVDIIDEQNKSINDAKELFGHISDAVNALKEGLDNIASLNEQMDASRENVVKSMEDVASVSTETAAASEEVSASAEEVNATMHTLNQFTVELDEIATHLTEAINRFEL